MPSMLLLSRTIKAQHELRSLSEIKWMKFGIVNQKLNLSVWTNEYKSDDKNWAYKFAAL